MNLIDEREFDELPEAVRLALVDLARIELAQRTGRDIALTPTQLAEATGIPPQTLHHEARIAMIKLQAAASNL